ncbi:putative CRISPR-associated protein [Candidatus Sordicultor fermentans]|uniref:putative CRISPR-associated protein n=1 Tax=Candidatus Sordicultor fermentans TaxID=1953203 RepID=UPI0016A33E4E|nr:putative CRISPR-associated protein [Candidatus Atribacteria bacterium]
MKKIITMVGTSIFDNYFEYSSDKTFKNHFEALKDRQSKDYNNELGKIEGIKKKISFWLKETDVKNASAEIKSLIKLKENLQDDFEVYLFSSDTILGRLAGEILEEGLKKLSEFEDGRITLDIIGDLQVKDSKKFMNGMRNLIEKTFKITNGYWDNTVINITGGYKATIPYLTILSQLNGCPIYYIFEDQDALIKIPSLPLSTEVINCEDLRNNKDIIAKLQKGIDNEKDYNELIYSDFYRKYGVMVWEDYVNNSPIAELNPLGKILWETCKNKLFEFYTNSQSKQKINNSQWIQEVISKKFWREEIRNNKTEYKNGHQVYDDGDNPVRIFYFVKEGQVYIYNVFDNHKEYERYLNSVSFSEDIELQEFELEIISKEVL